MDRRNPKNRVVVMAFFVGLLLLVGCGKEPEENGELPTERTGQAEEVTASADEAVDESEKHFQYDFRKLYPHLYEGMNVPEKIVSEEQAIEEGRIILTLQESIASSWLAESIKGFNRQSTDYFVKLLESGYGPEKGDCTERMAVEIMAGRGPDMFTGDMFDVNESILKKGILVDLSAGLDAMGITEEEYFPSVWALRMGDGVYGVSPTAHVEEYWILESVLGSRETPDIETLVEKLYTYPDRDAVWRPYATTTRILYYLLGGSEDLWGMIDWEEGKCDFSGELFAKMLEIAKRYVDPEGKKEEGIMDFYFPLNIANEPLEREKVKINFFFDDGNYPYYRSGYSLMLNANSDSKHQEGAWEFVKYILGEEGQGYCTSFPPANKEMCSSFYHWLLGQIEKGQSDAVLTEEILEEGMHSAERGRYFPIRTTTILEIICEEAQAFTDGDKSKEEVCKLIQNRVQLYLDETR
ncbi:MAG: ABC transporter substrate-binding protein [bacterium]|nr:ABC transporter substrate-binding protein [bacterium]MCM1374513.1 ABC transporter substrate-binding protein [Muribaculum sp.]